MILQARAKLVHCCRPGSCFPSVLLSTSPHTRRRCAGGRWEENSKQLITRGRRSGAVHGRPPRPMQPGMRRAGSGRRARVVGERAAVEEEFVQRPSASARRAAVLRSHASCRASGCPAPLRARQTRGFVQDKQFQVTWASSSLQARLMLSKGRVVSEGRWTGCSTRLCDYTGRSPLLRWGGGGAQ